MANCFKLICTLSTVLRQAVCTSNMTIFCAACDKSLAGIGDFNESTQLIVMLCYKITCIFSQAILSKALWRIGCAVHPVPVLQSYVPIISFYYIFSAYSDWKYPCFAQLYPGKMHFCHLRIWPRF